MAIINLTFNQSAAHMIDNIVNACIIILLCYIIVNYMHVIQRNWKLGSYLSYRSVTVTVTPWRLDEVGNMCTVRVNNGLTVLSKIYENFFWHEFG